MKAQRIIFGHRSVQTADMWACKFWEEKITVAECQHDVRRKLQCTVVGLSIVRPSSQSAPELSAAWSATFDDPNKLSHISRIDVYQICVNLLRFWRPATRWPVKFELKIVTWLGKRWHQFFTMHFCSSSGADIGQTDGRTEGRTRRVIRPHNRTQFHIIDPHT